MPAQVTAEMVNLKEFQAQLERLGDFGSADALEKAGTAGLLLVQNGAKVKAPVKTGTLRRSIHIQLVSKARHHVELAVGTDVVYGPIQEFGGVIAHTNLFGKGIAATITIPPHPYLRPAWDENRGSMIDTIKKALVELIRAAV